MLRFIMRSIGAPDDCSIGLRVTRFVVRSVSGYHECSYDRSQDGMIAHTIDLIIQRSIDRTIGRRPSRLIVGLHRSLIPTTSRTISYDGSCYRYFPTVRRSIVVCGRPLLEIVANIADRSHLGPVATIRTIQTS